MSISPECARCGNELDEPGGLLFGVPSMGTVTKTHLCPACTNAVMLFIEQPLEQPEPEPPKPAEPWWVHHPDHMKGWEAFGVTGEAPKVRRLGSGYDGKDEPGTDPWGSGEVRLGVAGIEFSTHADCTTGAFLYVVGTTEDDVRHRWSIAEQLFHSIAPGLWPASRR